MYKTKEEITNWLNIMGIEKYTIDEVESNIYNEKLYEDAKFIVNVQGQVSLFEKSLKEIPVQFGVVRGSFTCSCNELTSLKGCPIVVEGYFACNNNQLINFKYAPKIVGVNFRAENNKIETVDDLKSTIGGDLFIDANGLQHKNIDEIFTHAIDNLSVGGKILCDQENEIVDFHQYYTKNLNKNLMLKIPQKILKNYILVKKLEQELPHKNQEKKAFKI